MKLLLDIGNSRIKWGLLVSDGALEHSGVIPLGNEVLPYFFDELVSKYTITEVYAANVVGPRYEKIIMDWWTRYANIHVDFITTPKQFAGLTVGYQQPSTLGVDRFLTMLAARSLTTENFCCISCGTAITVDVVKNSGLHLGGHIIPGVRLFPTLLADNTLGCDVKMHEMQHQFDLANSTQEAMQNGALTAIVAYLNHMIYTIQQQFQQPVQFYLTGGDAELIKPHLKVDIDYQPTLVLEGIKIYLTT